jgi:hypothetical protein
MGRYHRLQQKAEKIAARLWESDDGKQWVKPPRIHWRTFDALVDRANAAALAADGASCASLAAIQLRHGFPGGK